MIIKNYVKLSLSSSQILAYKTKFNILDHKSIIFPHEETFDDSHITKDILFNSVIVLGVYFIKSDQEIEIDDKIFILDGHHRIQFIVNNSINEEFEVVMLDINDISIESYNAELLITEENFLEKIKYEKNFLKENDSQYYIEINGNKYCSNSILNIIELYDYKRHLLEDNIISPLPNNQVTQKTIINFTPLNSIDFSRNYVFPQKSTWITPRFDL